MPERLAFIVTSVCGLQAKLKDVLERKTEIKDVSADVLKMIFHQVEWPSAEKQAIFQIAH